MDPSSLTDEGIASIPVPVFDPWQEMASRDSPLRRALVATARALTQQHHIDEVQVPADEAVAEVAIEIWDDVRTGKLWPIKTLDDWWRAFHLVLRQFLVDQRRRQRAQKRGGRSGQSASAYLDEEFDSVDRRASPVDERIITEDQAVALCRFLDRHDPLLRAIAKGRRQEIPNEQIAEELHLSRWVFHEKLRRLRSLATRFFAEQE
jgi:hypothetical protein